MTMTDFDPETQIAPTAAAPEAPALAWSLADDSGVIYVDETYEIPDDQLATLLRDQFYDGLADDDLDHIAAREPVWSDADDRAYSWGTVKIFVALMAVTILAAAWIAVVWSMHRAADSGPAAAPAPPAAPISSPDDRIVPSALPPSPPPAPPMSIDDQYLTALRSDGISSGVGDSGSLGLAHAVCRARDNGRSLDVIASEIAQQNPNLSVEAAQFIMTAAIHYYCPPSVR